MEPTESINGTSPVSYSMYIDHRKLPEKNRSLRSIQQRQLQKWVDDIIVYNCYNCDIEFGWFLRKHHCRVCGHIFCHNCADQKHIIPKDYPNALPRPPDGYNIDITAELRMCKSCAEKITQFECVQKLIHIFSLLDLDIFDYKNIKGVCRLWQHLANYYMSIFRELQYKLPNTELSKFERYVLWTNRKYLTRHSRYLVQLLRSVTDPDRTVEALKIVLSKEKNTKCRDLMCTRWCEERIAPENALDLLGPSISSIEIKKFAVSLLDHANDEEFLCYVPFLVNAISYDGLSVVAKYLINKCKSADSILKNEVYWQLKINIHHKIHGNIYKHVLTHFKRSVKYETRFKIIDECLISKIRMQAKHLDQINPDKCLTDIIIPTDPTIDNATIFIKNVQILKSATRPLKIPYSYTRQEDKQTMFGSLLYKNEDLRKDQISMVLIRLMDMILKNELNTDFHIISYPVRPTSIDSGFIGIVEDCDTIYNIIEREKMTILNYIIEHNKDETIQAVKDRFIKSCAAYCVITHLLGIGDRHLDNIMVTKSGVLFHIDFGYILGQDPKLIGKTGMRISNDIVEALGGQNSSDYKRFYELCNTVYSCLRRHVNLFINMMRVLIDIDEKLVTSEILSRFVPGEIYQEAKLQLYSRIDNSSTANYSYYLVDFFHRHNKETPKAVKDFLSNTLSSAKSMVQTAIDTIYY
jgi:Phosphatidylinositol 3- and 4-kinase/Phosphoinositide 3-kinase family, accessory domain (PIK domain)/FYVE zinc finger